MGLNLALPETRQTLDKLTALLLRDWDDGEVASITARTLFDRLPSPFRSVVTEYVAKERQTALDRLAMLSSDIRQIISEGSGEDWIKEVFAHLELLSK